MSCHVMSCHVMSCATECWQRFNQNIFIALSTFSFLYLNATTRNTCNTGSRSSRISVNRGAVGADKDGRSSSRKSRHKMSRNVVDLCREKKTESAAMSKSYSPWGLNDNEDLEADALQITPHHAFVFILLSSSFLLVMYFIDIYSFVSIIYLLSAGFASAVVFFIPFFSHLVRTYTAIRHNVKIEHVSEASSSDNICGTTLPVICSGKSCMCRYCCRLPFCHCCRFGLLRQGTITAYSSSPYPQRCCPLRCAWCGTSSARG